MPSFPFVDAEGRSWLAIPGLPANHPAAAALAPLSGITFYGDGGEVRVLPAAEFPRRVASSVTALEFERPRRPRWLDFAGLLPYAHPWPPTTEDRGAA